MKPVFLAALAAGGFLLLASQSKASPSSLVRGKAYRAVFQMPESLALSPTLDANLKAIMPPGSDIIVDKNRVQVKFIAPTDAPIGDLQTPLGTIQLVTLELLG